MRYRPLGSSGLLVSVVGLGCNNFGRRLDLDATRAVLDAALDEGVTLLDTADTYGESEALMGEVLAGRRDRVVLATKFGHQRTDLGYGPAAGAKGGRAYVRRAVQESLRRLRTDHLDLLQLHTPDPITPVEETLEALHELVTAGLVRYVGHSNLTAWETVRADHLAREHGWTRPISAQVHYSLLERDVEAEVVPACEAYGIGVLPYFPLANGLLTGKVRRGEGAPQGSRLHGRDDYLTDSRLDTVEALAKWGADHGCSLLEIAIGALAAQPVVASVIAGATTPEQVRANVAAGDWQPIAEELAEIDAIAPTRRPSP